MTFPYININLFQPLAKPRKRRRKKHRKRRQAGINFVKTLAAIFIGIILYFLLKNFFEKGENIFFKNYNFNSYFSILDCRDVPKQGLLNKKLT
jgi:hypothetical protein